MSPRYGVKLMNRKEGPWYKTMHVEASKPPLGVTMSGESRVNSLPLSYMRWI